MPIQTPICDFGQKAHDFKLKSTDNKIISLDDIKGENGTLIMFICNHCPYVKAVTKDINDLMVDINNEVNNIDIDLDVSAEHQMSKYRELNKDLYEYRNNPTRQRDERNEKKA